MNTKAIALGTVIGFLIAVAPSCGAAKCSSANCDGCCDAKGVCAKKPNNANNTTCGSAGGACADCAASSKTCDSATFTCGGGATDAGGGACDGCKLSSGTCVSLANTSSFNCGKGGATCAGCATNQTCTAGACVTVDSGVPTGRLGDTCARDSDCNHVPLTNSGKAYCKKTSVPGNTSYQGGYCTRYCTSNSKGDCGAGNFCSWWMGPTGEAENICYKGCADTSECRAGYSCEDLGWSGSPMNSCIPLLADGGFAEFDAGPGTAARAAGPCTVDGQCGPAPYFSCVPETEPDGGHNPFPGGTCYGDCSYTISDTWCGDAGICLPTLAGTTAHGSLVGWICNEQCTPGAATNTCRTGYVCDDWGSGIGTCTPDCRTTANACSQGYSCGDAGTCQ